MTYQSMVRDAIAVVAVFAFVGLGVGVTGYLSLSVTIDLYGGSGGQAAETLGELFVVLVLVQSLVVAMLLGPVVAGVAGVFVGLWTERLEEALVVGGLGSLIGFYPMIALAAYLTAMAMSGAGVSGLPVQAEPVISPVWVLALAIPTGVVGLLASGVVYWRSH